MKITDCRLVFKRNGKLESAVGFDNDWFSLEISEEARDLGKIYSVNLTANKKLEPVRLEFYAKEDLLGLSYHANGYQSWSESPYVDYLSYKKNLSKPIQEIVRLKWYGDYAFTEDERKKRWMHSHLFINLQEDGETRLFLGDMKPWDSYTWFVPDYDKSTIEIISDLEGMTIEETETIEAAVILKTTDERNWLSALGINEQDIHKITGWTSWYNYYTGISEEILRHNIMALHKSGIPMDIFQIDDGYFEAVGDWLIPNKRFPSGMASLAETIKEHDWTPGIWLAPFVCERESSIFREKSHWILRDSKGKLQIAGWNPNWSGVFYALDIYNEEVREYLRNVFTAMKQDWGYGFFKLDFLYAACLVPQNNKTRAMIMTDAMDLLRDLTDGALFLSCGVPIGPAMSKCDYCRIGADISHGMEDGFLKSIGYRERVSTFSALGNIGSRAFLDGRAFGNDPDVFILRDTKEIKLSREEKRILFETNMNNSSLVFFSDDVSIYDEETKMKVASAFQGFRTDKSALRTNNE